MSNKSPTNKFGQTIRYEHEHGAKAKTKTAEFLTGLGFNVLIFPMRFCIFMRLSIDPEGIHWVLNPNVTCWRVQAHHMFGVEYWSCHLHLRQLLFLKSQSLPGSKDSHRLLGASHDVALIVVLLPLPEFGPSSIKRGERKQDFSNLQNPWLIGTLIMAYERDNWVVCHPLYNPTKQDFDQCSIWNPHFANLMYIPSRFQLRCLYSEQWRGHTRKRMYMLHVMPLLSTNCGKHKTLQNHWLPTSLHKTPSWHQKESHATMSK